MTGFTAWVDSEEFARILTNALAFFPARGLVDFANLRISANGAQATGTDTYTMGRDFCDVDTFKGTPASITLDRDGWRVIEENARKDKGGQGRLEYLPGDCLTFHPGTSGTAKSPTETAVAQDMSKKPWPCVINGLEGEDFWNTCDELLMRFNQPPQEIPDVLCFNPAYFGRFQKVKTSKGWDGNKVLDFCYQGQNAPMLAKVGPSFVGLIMPIDRQRHAEANGGEHLWN